MLVIVTRGDEVSARGYVGKFFPSIAIKEALDVEVGCNVSPSITHSEAMPAIFHD